MRDAEEKEGAEATVGVSPDELPTGPGSENGKYDSSLLKALHTVFWAQFWLAGSLKFVAGTLYVRLLHCQILPAHLRSPPVDTLTTTTPLVNQVLLSWLTKSYIYFRASGEERATLGL